MRRTLLVVLLAIALLAAGCSGRDEPSSTTTKGEEEREKVAAEVRAEEVAPDDEFYEVPDPLPEAEHGTLLKYQVVADVVENATTYRVMYLSTSIEGAPIAVTGLAVVPTAPAPSEGRVVLTSAHGTTGIADECAPSKSPTTSEARRLGQVTVERGWILASTDYEGLGTPGRHPYLVGPSEGRSVLDAVLAVRRLPDAEVAAEPRALITGYSQGGHAAAWANEIAASWTPDVDVVGTFAGAPATEIERILEAGRTLPIGGFVLAIVAGYETAYPEADPAAYLTEKGLSLLPTVDSGCIVQTFAATEGLQPAELVKNDPAGQETWIRLGSANNPGGVAASDPVLIVHSDQDGLVPPVLSQLLHARMCASGQVVERRVLVGGGDHGAAVVPAYTAGIAWLQGLLDGTPPVNDCGSGSQ